MNKYCPLCKKFLIEISFTRNLPKEYNCSQRVHFNNKYQTPHYVEYETHTQMFIGMYMIHNQNNASTVLIYDSSHEYGKYAAPVWKKLFETELIKPDSIEKLQKRLKLLTVFS